MTFCCHRICICTIHLLTLLFLLLLPVTGAAVSFDFQTRDYYYARISIYFRSFTAPSAEPLREQDVRSKPDVFLSSRSWDNSFFIRHTLGEVIYLNGPGVDMGEDRPDVRAVVDVLEFDGSVRTYWVNPQFIYDLKAKKRVPFTCEIFPQAFLRAQIQCPALTPEEIRWKSQHLD